MRSSSAAPGSCDVSLGGVMPEEEGCCDELKQDKREKEKGRSTHEKVCRELCTSETVRGLEATLGFRRRRETE